MTTPHRKEKNHRLAFNKQSHFFMLVWECNLPLWWHFSVKPAHEQHLVRISPC